MKNDLRRILKQYWGFDTFRPLQEDIILSALDGKDTLALLPTGGGKSICFQVPVMAREGIGIVVSPLIALMADQVKNLKKINIPAIALTSGLSYRELDLGLDNCVNGHYKFLYLSPERLQSEIVRERIKRMKVNLLVVDEAHCISQWGYDFRPPYTRIAEVRDLIPGTSVLALTATATPRVTEDIAEKLEFREKKIIQKSFYRPNLYYNVNHTEKKWSKTVQILQRIKGSGIIYMRNRKHCVEVADWLQRNGISADYYHAGLKAEERKKKQDAWIKNEKRIIVSTNAFGMGIDKPDVRIVLHLDLPDSLEAYFQEAGRAGRDGEASWSVVLVGPPDVGNLKSRYLDSFPDLDFIKKMYRALANHFQMAIGTGEGQSFPFDITEFTSTYSLSVMKTYQALNILEKEGLIAMNESFKESSRVLIKVGRTQLYDFQLRNPKLDPFIKTLSRSYGGIDIEYTPIDETVLAQRTGLSAQAVRKTLLHLKKQGLLDYIHRKADTQIIFTVPRQSVDYLSVSDENLKDRYEEKKRRIQAVIDYVSHDDICRSIRLLKWFGEDSDEKCGHCDVCRRKKSTGLSADDFHAVRRKVLSILTEKNRLSHDGLLQELKTNEAKATEVIRWLVDEGQLKAEDGFIGLSERGA